MYWFRWFYSEHFSVKYRSALVLILTASQGCVGIHSRVKVSYVNTVASTAVWATVDGSSLEIYRLCGCRLGYLRIFWRENFRSYDSAC